jgi:5-formyltetrahydrofolate cyclo-ligase
MAVPPPSADPVPPPDKAALRTTLRGARRAFVAALDPEAYAAALAAIDRHLSPLLAREGPISGYLAQRGEADVLPFLLRAFHLRHTIALPHVEGPPTPDAAVMHFVRWHPDARLAPGRMGIPQPEAGGDMVVPAVLLTPLVGFDRRGRRLGQGGGYYDRWFAAHPEAMRIGIAWSVQEVDALPVDPWDMPLHAIVTEKEWIEP